MGAQMMNRHDLIFAVGLLGIVFYVLSPILFPSDNLRQPELLPVYSLMMGLGQILKGNDDDDEKPA